MKTDQFLFFCREAYRLKIYPVKEGNFNKGILLEKLPEIEEEMLANKGEAIKGMMVEYQYFINLWAAHVLIEFELHDTHLLNAARDVISRYAKSTLNPEVAEEETLWLSRNGKKS